VEVLVLGFDWDLGAEVDAGAAVEDGFAVEFVADGDCGFGVVEDDEDAAEGF